MEELKLIKLDIENLNKKVNELEINLESLMSVLEENFKRLIPSGILKRYTCSSCDGKGIMYKRPRYADEDYQRCEKCKGTGTMWE